MEGEKAMATVSGREIGYKQKLTSSFKSKARGQSKAKTTRGYGFVELGE